FAEPIRVAVAAEATPAPHICARCGAPSQGELIMGRAPTKTLSAALATSTLVASALLAAPAAFAAETCDGKTVTKVVSSGTYEGTSGQDVVIVKGQATVKLGAGSDTVCVQTDGRVTAYLGEGQDKFFGAG